MKIRCIDVETTGLEAIDHVVGIAAWDWTDGDVSFVASSLVKPPVAIPIPAMAIHHITDADVAGAPDLASIWPMFHDPSVDAYCAHNSRFEAKFLKPPKPWVDTYRAALRLWPDAPSHNLQALRYFLKLEFDQPREFVDRAHRASPDAYVTAHLLGEILKQPKVDLVGLIKCAQAPALLPTVRFGKHSGKKWADVDLGYLEWVAKAPEMDEDAVYTAKRWLKEKAKG